MCNTCGNSTCYGNCYPSVPNQWNTCSSQPVQYCPPVPCPVPPPPFPFNGIYTQFARVLTSQLDFFGMPATKKILVAAPGAGKMIVPINIFNILKFGTTPYSDITPVTPTMLIELGAQGIISDASVLGAMADQTTFYSLGLSTYAGILDNQPLTLTTNVQSVVGNSNLYTYITYIVVSV